EVDIPRDARGPRVTRVIQAIAGDPEGIALGEQHVPEGRHALILVEIGTIALHQDLPLLEAHLADQSLRAGGHILVELPALRIEDLHALAASGSGGLRKGRHGNDRQQGGSEVLGDGYPVIHGRAVPSSPRLLGTVTIWPALLFGRGAGRSTPIPPLE